MQLDTEVAVDDEIRLFKAVAKCDQFLANRTGFIDVFNVPHDISTGDQGHTQDAVVVQHAGLVEGSSAQLGCLLRICELDLQQRSRSQVECRGLIAIA